MAAPRPGEQTLNGTGSRHFYRRFLEASEELTAAALFAAGSAGPARGALADDPAAGWAVDAAPTIVDRVGAALLADDSRILLDYLSVELAQLRRAGVAEVHLIALVDAIAASLPEDFAPARRILAEGREHLRRAGARPVRAVPSGLLAGAATETASLAIGTRPPGQAFTDLLLLGALACQTPVAVVSVPQTDGTWRTLSHGFDSKDGSNDGQLFGILAAAPEPVQIADLATRLPRSSLVLSPHSMRWAYGVGLRNDAGSVIGVVAVLDRWLRQITKREQRALASLARQLSQQLVQWRQSAPAGAEAAPPAPAPGRLTGAAAGSGLGALASDRHHLLRSQEVAEIFDVTERTVINWAAAGKLPSLRTIGGHLRFRREDVLRLLAPPAE
ncbi:MAG TPA: helix-turn-helix domain-containing protein [Acidimicrobiales bacterium]|jgi:excisionase family DNA binding protein